MDEKTAFEILNLKDFASFEDAKKAYRTLAKKYHPDIVGKDPWPGNDAGARMKEINLAFRYLAPRLKLNKTSKNIKEKIKGKKTEEEKPIKTEKGRFFVSLSKIFGDFFKSVPKKEQTHVFKSKLKKEKTLRKPKCRTNLEKACFDDVFKSVNKGNPFELKKTVKSKRKRSLQKSSSSPYNGYQKFMALKRKMKAGQARRDQNMGITRVEKIESIKPVNPVPGD